MISTWTRSTEGGYVSRLAIGKHLREHLGIASRAGRRPVSGRLLEEIVAQGEEGLEDGTLRVQLKDALAAQKALDHRMRLKLDQDTVYKITMALSGAVPQRPRLLEPLDIERDEQEAEFRALLDGGDATDAKAAVKRLSEASNG